MSRDVYTHTLSLVLKQNLVVYQGADVFALDDFLEVTHDVHIEDVDGKVVLHAHGCCGNVHYLEALGNDILVGDVLELGGGRVLLGVCTLA